VVKKGEFDEITDFVDRIKGAAQNNPLYFGAGLLAIVFLILFVIGSTSS
jgi:hypothetical protein